MSFRKLSKDIGYIFFWSVVLGLAGGLPRSVWEVQQNDWIFYGLTNLLVWEFVRICVSWSAIIFLVAVAGYATWHLLLRCFANRVTAQRVFSVGSGLAVGAAISALWGFAMNTGEFRAAWRSENADAVMGVSIPAALTSPNILFTNVGIVLTGAAVAVLLYFVIRLVLGRPRLFVDSRLSRMIRVAGIAFVVLLAAGTVAQSRGPEKDHPNIVLISVDTLRADYLGCYGFPLETSPNIDAWARGGVVFEDAVAQANWTVPSHMSIMTSQVPTLHGVKTVEDRLAKKKVTLAEVLRNFGYSTIGITGGYNVDPRFGFGQGFDEYHGDDFFLLTMEEKLKYGQGIRLSQLLPNVYRMLDGQGGRPFFLFLHFWDVHAPYMPHDDIIGRFSSDYNGPIEVVTHELMREINKNPERLTTADVARIRALYANEIRYADQYLGELFGGLEERGLTENTIVLLTSDHGDELMEHNIVNHGVALYQPEIHVPLILSYPKRLEAGVRIKNVVGSIDIAPTLLDLAGVAYTEEVRREFQGRSLVELLRGGDGADEPMPTISEGAGEKQTALRNGPLKYILNRKGLKKEQEELYDLGEDPGEEMSLHAERPDVRKLMRTELRRYVRSASEGRTFGSSEKIMLDNGFRKKLKTLGYVQ